MNLTLRIIFIVTIIVAVTDTIIFYKIRKDPAKLTIPFLILVILVTVIPIAINIWYHLKIGR